jgi:hypothetical protein
MTSHRFAQRLTAIAIAASLMTGIGVAPLYAVDGKDTQKTAATKKKAKTTAAPREQAPKTTTGGSPAMSGYRNDINIGNGY